MDLKPRYIGRCSVRKNDAYRIHQIVDHWGLWVAWGCENARAWEHRAPALPGRRVLFSRRIRGWPSSPVGLGPLDHLSACHKLGDLPRMLRAETSMAQREQGSCSCWEVRFFSLCGTGPRHRDNMPSPGRRCLGVGRPWRPRKRHSTKQGHTEAAILWRSSSGCRGCTFRCAFTGAAAAMSPHDNQRGRTGGHMQRA